MHYYEVKFEDGTTDIMPGFLQMQFEMKMSPVYSAVTNLGKEAGRYAKTVWILKYGEKMHL